MLNSFLLSPLLIASITRLAMQALLIVCVLIFIYCTIAGMVLFVKFIRTVMMTREEFPDQEESPEHQLEHEEHYERQEKN